jgi:DHA2 family multidrug resistance protein
MSTPAEIVVGAAPATETSEGARMLAFLVMAFGMFMALIDIQIVTSSLAEIQAGLAATSDEVSSVQTSYLVAEVIMIPLSGWLTRIFSTRWLFTISAAGFTVASVACAFAWNLQSMVVFRAIQGFVGGAMIPTVFATGFVMFTGPSQTRIPAILGLVATLAPTLGPSVGGYITDHLSWRWLFFVNIVPGVAISLLVPRLVKIDKPNLGLIRQFDLVGVALLTVFLGALQYVLEEGAKNNWFQDDTLLLLSIASALAFVLFIWRSLTFATPVVDLRAFRSRNFLMGCVLSFVTGIGLYGMIYLSPLFLGLIRGYNAAQVGGTLWVVGLFQVLATPFTVIAIQRMDVRIPLLGGIVLVALSNYQFSLVTPEWGFWEMFWPQAIRGIGFMFCIVPVTRIALGELSAEQLSGASGLYNLMRNLGGAVGLAILNTQLFYDRFALHYERLAESVSSANPLAPSLLGSIAAIFRQLNADVVGAAASAQRYVARLLTQQALTLSFADVFLMLAVVFVAAVPLVPLVRRMPIGAEQGIAGE